MKIVEYLGSQFCLTEQMPALFIFGVWKSGSTLVNEAVKYCAQRNNSNYISIPDQLFQDNIDLIGDYGGIVPPKLILPGNVYGGFRCFPRSLLTSSHFAEGLKIVMVRDPRDALVSQYYSYAGSHDMPAGDDNSGPRARLLARRSEIAKMSIDEFVIQDSVSQSPYSIRESMLSYHQIMRDETALFIRYEDIIFRKESLLNLICDHFHWHITEQDRHDILVHIDVLPQTEDATRFIRRVIPGDHIDKLKAETIAQLNVNLREVLGAYGYPEIAPRASQPLATAPNANPARPARRKPRRAPASRISA